MNRFPYSVGILLQVFLLVSSTAQANDLASTPSCSYERKIHDLSEALKTSEGSQDRAEAITKRIELINDLHQLDIDSQFTFCSDEDGKATLKFNTPEEKLRDSIERLVNLIAWFKGLASKLGTTVATNFTKQAEDDLKRLRDIKKQIDKRKTAGLTKKGTVEEVFPEYEQQRKQRREAMDGLADRADTVLCLGISAEDMELARLYHETIPQDSSCNPLLKKNLLDRIQQSQTIAFGALLEKETYQRAGIDCKNVEPLESAGSWGGRRVEVKQSVQPFMTISSTNIEKTIEKTFRDGKEEKLHAKVAVTKGPPERLDIGRLAPEEVNFVVEGEIGGFVQKLSAEGMNNDLKCVNCEFKVLGGYQQVHKIEQRYCSESGTILNFQKIEGFVPRINLDRLKFCRRKYHYELQVVATSKKKAPEIHLKGDFSTEIIWTFKQRN